MIICVWLAKIKSAFEMNDIRRGRVTCYMGPAGAVRPDQVFGRDSSQFTTASHIPELDRVVGS